MKYTLWLDQQYVGKEPKCAGVSVKTNSQQGATFIKRINLKPLKTK